jgi:glutathione S-transferase
MALRLYERERSPYCRTIRWVIARKRLDCERIEVDDRVLAKLRGRYGTDELPLAEDGDAALAGSRAIVSYLERTYGTPSVFPADPQKRNQAVTLAEFADEAIGRLALRRLAAEEPHEAILTELRAALAQTREAIARRALDSGACHLGDIAVAAHLLTCEEIPELEFARDYADLVAYVERVREKVGEGSSGGGHR